MGLLDDTTQQQYYQGNDHGSYQFTSLDDIITQFQIAYVGEGKIISKIKRADIAFHAQRAMQELSFDTFKSIKAQEITLPASLQMTLPQDYVNYTKISWVDSAGIKHLLYPASKTSNPLPLSHGVAEGIPNTITAIGGQSSGGASTELVMDGIYTGIAIGMSVTGVIGIPLGTTVVSIGLDATGDFTVITMSAAATETFSNGQTYTFTNSDGSTIMPVVDEFSTGSAWRTSVGKSYIHDFDGPASNIEKIKVGMNAQVVGFPPGTTVVGVNPAPTTTSILGNDVNFVFLSSAFTGAAGLASQEALFSTPSAEVLSTTWSNYKSGTPSENQDDYQDDTYWPMDGSRYGLDPQHAQANGSFYIDDLSGKIHFSSNISGKTVILDYISDSLGTDGEMQVHKFAEEAMYKYIAYAILSTSSQPIHQQLAPRFKKERFAETRKAKLRLSNIKLEELTQILRGKSKQIKH